MKYPHLTSLLIVLLIGLGFGCSRTQPETVKSQVPQLLQRQPSLQNGKEWDRVQNEYAAQMKALRNKPEALQPRLRLANLFTAEARITGEHGHYYPAALQMTDEILATDPKDHDLKFLALSTKAGVQLSLHQFKEALETGLQALEINRYNAAIYGVLTDAYTELGQYGKAVEMADQMMNIRPDLRSYSRVSYQREIHGDLPGAIEAMEMAVAAGPPATEETAWAMLTLGKLYEMKADTAQAAQIFRELLQFRPDYPFATASLGDLAIQQGRLARGEQLLKEAIEAIPEVGFYISLAALYKNQNRTAEFEQLIPEILAMLEDDTVHGHDMRLEYAHLYRDLLDDPNKALEYARSEYERRPDNIDVNALLAEIYLDLKDINQARLHATKATVTQSSRPDILSLQKQLAVK